MARIPKPSGWTKGEVNDGVIEITCRGWPSFEAFLHDQMVKFPDYLWRGQRCSDWPLLSSLDRRLRDRDISGSDSYRNMLRRFRLAVRGRRAPGFPPITTDNEWWALGQHFGLATPLLDWTASPYIAAYFAFAEPEKAREKYRIVYGLATRSINNVSAILKKRGIEAVEFVIPLSDDNARLLHQRGMFTKLPSGIDLESWIRKHFAGRTDVWALIKIIIPAKMRGMFLRSLERMAISALDLFPDVSGASMYCNLALEVENYSQALVETEIFGPQEAEENPSVEPNAKRPVSATSKRNKRNSTVRP